MNYFQNSYGNMTYDQCYHIIQQPCFYCGLLPVTRKIYPEITEKTIYNYIDRKDPNKPKDVDNCVACCKDCKNMRNHMTVEEFHTWLRRAYAYSFIR